MASNARKIAPITAPVALLALAAVMPLAVGEAAAMGGGSRASVMAGCGSQDRAGTIVRCVNEAARRFIGPQVALPPVDRSFVDIDLLSSSGTAAAPGDAQPGVVLLGASLIDMPPPSR